MAKRKREQLEATAPQGAPLAAWKLPPIVAAISISIVLGFYLGGPGLGMAVGGMAAAAIVAMAIRNPPRPPIVPPPPRDLQGHLLVVVGEPLEEPTAVEQVAEAARSGAADGDVLLLAPMHNSFLDRWACDLDRGRRRAQRNLVLSAAALARTHVAATARVGDERLVQAVEDELGSFPATEVVLVTAAGDAAGRAAAEELRSRLRTPFRHVAQRVMHGRAPHSRIAAGKHPVDRRK